MMQCIWMLNRILALAGLNLSPGSPVLVFSSSVGDWVNGSIVERLSGRLVLDVVSVRCLP